MCHTLMVDSQALRLSKTFVIVFFLLKGLAAFYFISLLDDDKLLLHKHFIITMHVKMRVILTNVFTGFMCAFPMLHYTTTRMFFIFFISWFSQYNDDHSLSHHCTFVKLRSLIFAHLSLGLYFFF